MIKLKPRPELPKTLASDEVRDFAAVLKRRVDNGDVLQSDDFKSAYWQKKDIKKALFTMHSGKCCYCERKRDETRETDVEHFRPKAGVIDDPHHPGYWWQAYDWNNYFYSCKKCNQGHKINQFPLMAGSPRAHTPTDNLANERPFLINSEKENPEDFITFEWSRAYGVFVKAIGLDDEDGRGDRTIKITGLNEGTIPEERASLVKDLEGIVDTMKWALREDKLGTIKRTARIIKENSSSGREFTGFRRAFFRGHGLGEYIAKD